MFASRPMYLVLAVIVLAGIGAAPATQPADLASEQRIKSLERMLSAVTAQNVTLEKKNASLQSQVNFLQLQLSGLGLQPRGTVQPPVQPATPDGWVARKFNGTTYYLVPLDGARPGAPTTRPALK